MRGGQHAHMLSRRHLRNLAAQMMQAKQLWPAGCLANQCCGLCLLCLRCPVARWQQGCCAIRAQDTNRDIPVQRPSRAWSIHLTTRPHSRVISLPCSMPGWHRICLEHSMRLFCVIAADLRSGQAAHAGRHSTSWWCHAACENWAPPAGPLPTYQARQRSSHCWQAECMQLRRQGTTFLHHICDLWHWQS